MIVDALDAGKGATNVAVSVAGGAYQFGWVDMPSMIRFNAMNPSSPLLAVYISFDDSPLAVVTRKDAGIQEARRSRRQEDRGRPRTAVHDTVSILLKAAKAENVKIEWVGVQPQLFGPMLKRGEVAGTGGFTNSNIPAALELGFTDGRSVGAEIFRLRRQHVWARAGHDEEIRRRKSGDREGRGGGAQPRHQRHHRRSGRRSREC